MNALGGHCQSASCHRTRPLPAGPLRSARLPHLPGTPFRAAAAWSRTCAAGSDEAEAPLTLAANAPADSIAFAEQGDVPLAQAAPAISSPNEGSATEDGEAQDPAVEAAEAALRAFWAAAGEIFKLAVLLPLRYLVLAPLGWMLTRLGLLAVNPGEVLERLDTANNASPVQPAELAAVLRSLNRHHSKAVAEFVEARCLTREAAPSSASPLASAPSAAAAEAATSVAATSAAAPFAVDAAVIREYLVALVKSGRLKEYGDETAAAAAGAAAGRSSTPPAEGHSHRSLRLLLTELQAAAGGEPLISSPGSNVAWPLHVVVQGGGALRAPAPTGLMATLQSWFWFLSTCFLFGLAWAVGAAAVRNYGRAGGSPLSAGAMAPPGMAASSSASPSMFAPKEYSKENMPEKSVKSFKDVKGCDEAVAELEEIVAYLKNPDKFTRLGGKLPKGVLLTGPPGTGKTLLARAVAGEAGVPFFYKAGSEFDEMFVGVGSRRVRGLFAAAKKKAPCIVFIDEIDAVGGKRTNWEASGGSRKTLNQLLTDMDGFEENSGVVVIAATNLPEMLDSALTRPGRFDRHVAVALPDVRGRRQILDLYLAGKPLAADVDPDMLARRTPGLSGAQLSNLINEGALLAARRGEDSINAALLDEARDKVLMGAPRSLVQSEEARRLTAYHEGGHALVALCTPGAKPIHKATIVPRGHALGMVSQVPDKDEYSTTRQQMTAHVDVCMGGKAAEELIFGAEFVTSGATSDLRAATRMVRHMVEDCGMSEVVGPVAVGEGGSAGEGASAEVRRAVDGEVGRLLKEAYARVQTLLKGKEAELHRLAGALLERETLTQREIKEVVWGAEALAHEDAQAAQDEAAAAAMAAAAAALEPGTPTKGGEAQAGAEATAEAAVAK